ncbi:MAG: hypothetical protein ACRD2J_06540 [Thermoanaerobaculia bacterium]
MRRWSILLAIALSGCATAVPVGDYVEVLEGTTRVSCSGADLEGPFGPRLARGAMLVAPGGTRGAWVEVEARALEDGGGEGTCQNVSRLWIDENGAARVAFTQRPGWEGRNGNALDLVDWSPDGSRLVLELHTWTYPTDPADPVLLVWDAATNATEQLLLAPEVHASFGDDCAFRFRGRGFDESGWAIVEVLPREDAAIESCVDSARVWRVQPDGLEVESVAEGTLPRMWSTRTTPPRRSAPLP